MRWQNGLVVTDRTFTGQRSTGFGLLDYNARYYSPALGRFISTDAIVPEPGSPLAWDRYAYVQNNPVRYRDPSGHKPVCEGTASCSDQWRQDKAYSSLGESGFMKYEIRYQFGVYIKDSDDMEWSITILSMAYDAVNMINGKLQGNLKTMASGTTFTIMTGGDTYYGWAG